MDNNLKSTLNEFKKVTENFLPKNTNVNNEISAPTGKYADNLPVPEPVQTEVTKPEKVLLEFETVDRLVAELNKYSMRKIAFFAIFVAIIFVILQDWWMIVVVAAIYAVVYVFFTTPAHKMVHRITTYGINYNLEHLYKWEEFNFFYLDKKEDHDILILSTKLPMPGRIQIILPSSADPKKASEIINSFISIINKPAQTYLDKFVNFIGEKIRI